MWPGDGDPSTATAWGRIAVRRFRISPTRPVEDMKDMRARIRALLAMWAVAGLVIPAPASAQAPQEPSATAPAQPKFAAPQGGTLPLSLDEAVARALENNVDIQVERYNPRARRRERPGRAGLLRPVPVLHADQELDRHQGHERVQRRRDRQHQDRPLGLRRPAAAAHGRSVQRRLQQQQARHQQQLLDLQPRLQLVPLAQPHAAAAAELQDRRRAHADQAGQEEPRDHRRPVPSDR